MASRNAGIAVMGTASARQSNPSNLRLMAIAFTVARQNKDAKNFRDGIIGIAAAKVDIPSITRAKILAAHAAGKDFKRVF
ncbi:hypothetical protein MCOR20_007201 [Pyricularia oryzae]|nr:hypothetical protein MCOR20_007201 [Pyricularia oryzae]